MHVHVYLFIYSFVSLTDTSHPPFAGNIKPKFETLKNVSLVPNIKPYEKIKIRCLNGGH